jgi:organic radical activating enzyme
MDITSNVIIEITRKCNMQCPHCLRGGTQNKSLEDWEIYRGLRLLDFHGLLIEDNWNLTITGGEPLLHPAGIAAVNETCRQLHTWPHSVYIATNGSVASNAALDALERFSWAYEDEEELFTLSVSNDAYHDLHRSWRLQNRVSDTNLEKYVKRMWPREGHKSNLILQGRAEKNADKFAEQIWHPFNLNPSPKGGICAWHNTTDDDQAEVELYLNCDKQLVIGCDWSYVEQKKHALCRFDVDVCDFDVRAAIEKLAIAKLKEEDAERLVRNAAAAEAQLPP